MPLSETEKDPESKPVSVGEVELESVSSVGTGGSNPEESKSSQGSHDVKKMIGEHEQAQKEKFSVLISDLEHLMTMKSEILKDFRAGILEKMEQSLDESLNNSVNFHEMVPHIKATLSMYLKKNPIIDQSNESILSIALSMLKFSEKELQDLDAERKSLPAYKIDKEKT